MLNGVPYLLAAVFKPVGNDGPAIIQARFNAVDFVPPTRAEFSLPEITRFRMKCQSLNVAMSVGINFRPGVCLTCKRVSGLRLALDRKSVGVGKSVSGRVDIGGGRI